MIKKLVRVITRTAANENRRALYTGERITLVAPHPRCICVTDPDNPDNPPKLDTFNTLHGDLSDPQPHPHPLFRDRMQIRVQPFVQVQACKSCGGIFACRGTNYVEAEKANA